MKLKSHFAYRKFNDSRHRILYLFNDYYLQGASINVLREMGHQVVRCDIAADTKKMLEQILKMSVSLKPDCIMGTNHCGFDVEGKIAGLLAEFRIPVIMWYLDDFRFILQGEPRHANDRTLVCTFDRGHVKPLRRLGFRHVRYLPAAASFDPNAACECDRYEYLSNATTFVGSTFEETKARWYRPGYDGLLRELGKDGEFRSGTQGTVQMILQQRQRFDSNGEFYHYAGFVAAHATQLYRTSYLSRIRPRELHVFGDEKWRELAVNAHVHGFAPYHDVTPHIYGCSLINLNLSSRQLETAVNQRVFDVPAAGGFLITDWKESLGELFDVKGEIVSFRSAEELNDLIAFYETHPGQRERIVRKAREKIRKEHLLEHRLATMLSTARDLFCQDSD